MFSKKKLPFSDFQVLFFVYSVRLIPVDKVHCDLLSTFSGTFCASYNSSCNSSLPMEFLYLKVHIVTVLPHEYPQTKAIIHIFRPWPRIY